MGFNENKNDVREAVRDGFLFFRKISKHLHENWNFDYFYGTINSLIEEVPLDEIKEKEGIREEKIYSRDVDFESI